jgi:hypothetical protein
MVGPRHRVLLTLPLYMELQSSNGDVQIAVCTLRYALLQPRACYVQFAMCQLHVSVLHCIAAVMASSLECASYIARYSNTALVTSYCSYRALLDVVEITNTIDIFAPLLYFIYWLLHVSALVYHHQGASGSV